ncbi:MAG: hypothetical protein GTN89_08425, partial [Acidobacteria bacterium]|nr:hypothetical protein [Acidobacteriota bacterium]NIM63939.1 hypothetical protein [Acidobacteriota bacterium]NIO59355.1 hypothetical protein [Acidobacteriota bacterium]NIQ30380.1 hypothetical protein [Acidobacteriota bacterium]NIQ85307.1 hypothetical protein [Acidobacteriota bacterium]
LATAALGLLAFWRLWFWNPARRLTDVDAWLFLPADPIPQSLFAIAAAVVYRRRESVVAA